MTDLFLAVLRMSLTASVVILVLALLRPLLRRAPKTVSYLLWAAAGFRLICPVSLRSVLSLFRLFPSGAKAAAEQAVAVTASASGTVPAAASSAASLPAYAPIDAQTVLSSMAGPAEVGASLDPWQVLAFVASLVWIAGIAVFLTVSAIRTAALTRRLVGAVRLADGVWQSENVSSPFLFGLIRPRIYLPYVLGDDALRVVLAHERVHLKRGDHWVKAAAFLILVVHWFNPLVWLAFWWMTKDMEMSCDERVLRENAALPKTYGMSLLAVASGRRFPAPIPLAFGESAVKSRIRNVLNWKRPSLWVTLIASALAVLVTVSCVTNPPQKTTEETPAAPEDYVTTWFAPKKRFVLLQPAGWENEVVTESDGWRPNPEDGVSLTVSFYDRVERETGKLPGLLGKLVMIEHGGTPAAEVYGTELLTVTYPDGGCYDLKLVRPDDAQVSPENREHYALYSAKLSTVASSIYFESGCDVARSPDFAPEPIAVSAEQTDARDAETRSFNVALRASRYTILWDPDESEYGGIYTLTLPRWFLDAVDIVLQDRYTTDEMYALEFYDKALHKDASASSLIAVLDLLPHQRDFPATGIQIASVEVPGTREGTYDLMLKVPGFNASAPEAESAHDLLLEQLYNALSRAEYRSGCRVMLTPDEAAKRLRNALANGLYGDDAALAEEGLLVPGSDEAADWKTASELSLWQENEQYYIFSLVWETKYQYSWLPDADKPYRSSVWLFYVDKDTGEIFQYRDGPEPTLIPFDPESPEDLPFLK